MTITPRRAFFIPNTPPACLPATIIIRIPLTVVSSKKVLLVKQRGGNDPTPGPSRLPTADCRLRTGEAVARRAFFGYISPCDNFLHNGYLMHLYCALTVRFDEKRKARIVPRIFDNIEGSLLPALKNTLMVSERADFCVGYFNLRGWRNIDALVEQWSGKDGACCRLVVGMQRVAEAELRAAFTLLPDAEMDNQTAARLRTQMAREFRTQLTFGAPSNADEAGLRRLSKQLKAKKLVVKLFLRYPLHAKLYLAYRADTDNPRTAYMGSSNLTFAGLKHQGELNVDVLDHDATAKLERWFNDRWQDQFCIDISDELAETIDKSWAREIDPPPYHIYLKIAYHLAQEAREGLREGDIPPELDRVLFEYQKAAVKIAARHVKVRGGVLLDDVVGLGKTLMATTLARMLDDEGMQTLIICPKNLVTMWQGYVDQYVPTARVKSLSTVAKELPELRRYPIVLIDESQNLRNREGKRYKIIQEYIVRNGSKCILLSATPYNKSYLDIGAQLALFLDPDKDLGIRPEQELKRIGEIEFQKRHQCGLRTLKAFEHSEFADDWREMMRRYLVRRTRSFIRDNYAKERDPITGRPFLRLANGKPSFFPERKPHAIMFPITEGDASDQYGMLYASATEDAINALSLPRYGLGNYAASKPDKRPTNGEQEALDNLSRAGKRLMGFCRTNLFKRLESGGDAFIQSIERHILRNYIYLHAIAHGLDLPTGTQDAAGLDSRIHDEDADALVPSLLAGNDGEDTIVADETAGVADETVGIAANTADAAYRTRADAVYRQYTTKYKRQFKWLRPSLFDGSLAHDLRADAHALIAVRERCGAWNADGDKKLALLVTLLTEWHPREKVLIFTQFADTARYLHAQLVERGITHIAAATGDSDDPTALARRFSPMSNGARKASAGDLRVLVATDVLSEGQNLQDCAIVVNYDLPWAIIRLIQRAGRVDRIGQEAETIHVYSFLPADGIERIIRLRGKVRQRLRQNAEVIGADETFFTDDADNTQFVRDLFTEKSGILDDADDEGEVDLTSFAYQIWKNAIEADPSLEKTIKELPDVAYSTKAYDGTGERPPGVLLYTRTASGNDALAWVNEAGQSVTESQLAVLRAAECHPDTAAIPRHAQHHALVEQGVTHLIAEEKNVGGQLGRPSGARFRVYERMKWYITRQTGTLFDSGELRRAHDAMYRYPLYQSATDTLNRLLKTDADDTALANMLVALWVDGRLCDVKDDDAPIEPQIICSLGLFPQGATE